MFGKTRFIVFSLLVVVTLLLASCAPAAQPTAAAPQGGESEAQAPTSVRIAVITGATIEEPYVKSLIQEFERFNAENKYDLKIEYDYPKT
jgi:ABC-type glycerol-3-phosphate transport system substrate-binding protein